MIDSKDLRIGNYLQRASGDIFQVSARDILLISEWDANVRLLPNPVELTEHWIYVFGFEKEEECDEGGVNDFRYVLHKNNHTLSLTSNWDSEDVVYVNYNQGGVDVFYVHQLQNLFYYLTGKEL